MRASHQRCRVVGLLTSIGTRLAGALLLGRDQAELHDQEHEMNVFSAAASMMAGLIMSRFISLDANDDNVVTIEELQAGIAYRELRGLDILHEMLAVCSSEGHESKENVSVPATSCSIDQMNATLVQWQATRATRSMKLLQHDPWQGFVAVPNINATEDMPCGPHGKRANGSPPNADADDGSDDELLRCVEVGPTCYGNGDIMIAWTLQQICTTRGCICDATKVAKRLAKVGYAGAVAVGTARDFYDPLDTVMTPACGDGWTVRKIVARANVTHVEDVEIQRIKTSAMVMSMPLEPLLNATTVDTEVALYRSPRHQLVRGGPLEPVCMISWQATRDVGDWRTNFMYLDRDFPYGPASSSLKAPGGIVVAYESVRDKVKAAFEEECCSTDFQAKKLVISGHSHGAAIAELHAIDVANWWECPRGRDLGASDITVVLFGVHKKQFTTEVDSTVVNCDDPTRCLAGSIVTISTARDQVADVKPGQLNLGPPQHLSVTWKVPCPLFPRGFVDARVDKIKTERSSIFDSRDGFCHGLENYAVGIEHLLVDDAGWGSSCSGFCGDLNRQLQCNQVVLINKSGCVYADVAALKTPTPCSSDAWDPDLEKCECHVDSCADLTTLGCSS